MERNERERENLQKRNVFDKSIRYQEMTNVENALSNNQVKNKEKE